MIISLLAAVTGTVVAVAGTIALASRCARTPRPDLIAWTCALFGLAVALGAQAAGFTVGFSQTTFRAVQLGAEVIAALGLTLGLAEVAARNVAARFAARLAVSALGVVGLVILATDPLSPVAFSKAFPAASVHFQPIPTAVLMYALAPFAALIALVAIGVTGVRARRDQAWRATLPAVAAAGAAAIALAAPGLAELADSKLGMHVSLASVFPWLCVLAAALAWVAGVQMSLIRLEVVHRGSQAADDGDWGGHRAWTGQWTGQSDPLTDAGRPGGYAGNGSGRYGGDQESGGYRDADTGYGQAADGAGYGNGADDARYGQSGYRRYGDDSGYGTPPAEAAGHGGPGPAAGSPVGTVPAGGGYDPKPETARPASWQSGGLNGAGLAGPPGMGTEQPGMPAADDHEAWSRLFGQIAIYTLLEDCVDAFDELTEAVVERVRAREPGTLVYIVHAVPSAPMQRILYEVYRDREACEEHKRQPYIAKFELDRRPYVLATNVIELGLQRAKLSASSSLDELLSESGVMPAVGPAKGGPAGGGAPGAGGAPLSANGHANGGAPRNAGGAGGPAPGLGRGPQRRR
jgi:quinol monooxygenase YgiN